MVKNCAEWSWVVLKESWVVLNDPEGICVILRDFKLSWVVLEGSLNGPEVSSDVLKGSPEVLQDLRSPEWSWVSLGIYNRGALRGPERFWGVLNRPKWSWVVMNSLELSWYGPVLNGLEQFWRDLSGPEGSWMDLSAPELYWTVLSYPEMVLRGSEQSWVVLRGPEGPWGVSLHSVQVSGLRKHHIIIFETFLFCNMPIRVLLWAQRDIWNSLENSSFHSCLCLYAWSPMVNNLVILWS